MFEFETKNGRTTIDEEKIDAAIFTRQFFSRYHNIQISMSNGTALCVDVPKWCAASTYINLKGFIRNRDANAKIDNYTKVGENEM